MVFDAIVIGAGASGLMCALTAAGRGRRVIVLDHNAEAGRKIMLSGGGRCNFSNMDVSSDHYISSNPHFCKSALSRFGADDFLQMMKESQISFLQEEDGRLFCKGPARLILEMLVNGCRARGVEIIGRCGVRRVSKGDVFEVYCYRRTFESKELIIATGGLSYMNLGASGLGYDVARYFGMNVIEPRPGLVPLVFKRKEKDFFCRLAGVSMCEVGVVCGGENFRGAVLITHRGLSGPAILDASLYWTEGKDISIDLFPNLDLQTELEDEKARGSRALLKNCLASHLPKRFAESWCEWNCIEQKPIAGYSHAQIRDVASKLKVWNFVPHSTEGFDSAEVTGGGVDTDQISSKTFESKIVRGLYFIGEVLDVTGRLGGYNLHWAWSSGHAAGMSL